MECDSKIFHAKKDAEIGKTYTPYSTRRPPANVPYLVDNLWEWDRTNQNEDYPSRRNAKFASPSKEQARDSAYVDSLDQVYCVEFVGEAAVAQMTTDKDAKEHRDVRALRKLIVQQLDGNERRYSWASQSLDQKTNAGRLFKPCLTADEVGLILRETDELNPGHIREEIEFWDDVVPIEPGNLNNKFGEIFFEYEGGFKLHPTS